MVYLNKSIHASHRGDKAQQINLLLCRIERKIMDFVSVSEKPLTFRKIGTITDYFLGLG